MQEQSLVLFVLIWCRGRGRDGKNVPSLLSTKDTQEEL